ncbi:MAG: hypothetical protein R2873_05855 [Caldilineaceae bacterium]
MLIGGSTNDFSAQQRTWSRYAGVILGVIMLGNLGVTILQRGKQCRRKPSPLCRVACRR